MDESYPVRLAIEYPDRSLNRLTTFFRAFTAIPIFIVLAAIGGNLATYWEQGDVTRVSIGGAALLILPPLLLILFRKKYPRWWFDWNLELLRFMTRVFVYAALLDDRYPSTDERQSVELDVDYPDVETGLGRGMPLVKWLLAIPHYVLLVFLYIGAVIAVIIAWFAILFTGRYPRPLFDFVVGVMRWYLRVTGYAFIMATDRYPPFSLD